MRWAGAALLGLTLLAACNSERARFGMRSRLTSKASAASFALPAFSNTSPSSSCEGLIGSAAPFGARIDSSSAAASFNNAIA